MYPQRNENANERKERASIQGSYNTTGGNMTDKHKRALEAIVSGATTPQEIASVNGWKEAAGYGILSLLEANGHTVRTHTGRKAFTLSLTEAGQAAAAEAAK